jgi:hypothetical protein
MREQSINFQERVIADKPRHPRRKAKAHAGVYLDEFLFFVKSWEKPPEQIELRDCKPLNEVLFQ